MNSAIYRIGRRFSCVTLLAFALAACEKEEQKAAPPPPVVKVAEAVMRDVPINVEAIGQTRGNTEIEISARVEGFLETMDFKEGSFVKKGQRLYTIDSRPFKASVAQAQAGLAEAKAELVRKHQDVERFKPLVEKNAVSRQEFETAVAQEKAQESAVAAAAAAAQKAGIELGYTTVIAPDEGLIGTTEAHPGTLVGGTQKALLTRISKIDPIHVRFSISERDYLFYAKRGVNVAAEPAPVDAGKTTVDAGKSGASQPAQPQARKAEFDLILADGSVHPEKGSLVFVDRNVDAKTGTIMLEASFPNPSGIVRPGQYARVRAAASVKKGAVLISQKSVAELQGLFNVAVVKPDGTVEVRPVKQAERVGDLVIIESGVKPGERLIVEGLQKVKPGIKVNAQVVPLEEATTPSPGGSAPNAGSTPSPAASGG
jgi:membrane fusion protein (multidrug efflux system)